MGHLHPLQSTRAGVLDVAWHGCGPADGPPVFLMHGSFERSAAAFDNDDFVDVVIHSYRHRYGLVPGDPAYAAIEARLALQPAIAVPTITFDGADDGVYGPRPPEAHAHRFTGPRSHRIVPGVGHDMPQEAPEVFAAAVLELVRAQAASSS